MRTIDSSRVRCEIGIDTGLGFYRLLDAFRERRADAGDRGEVRNRRLAHPADASEPPQQRALLGGSHAIDVVEDAPHGALRADVLVVRDREAMRLVADPLNEVEPLRGARQEDWVRPGRHEELLTLLRKRRDRDLQKP